MTSTTDSINKSDAFEITMEDYVNHILRNMFGDSIGHLEPTNTISTTTRYEAYVINESDYESDDDLYDDFSTYQYHYGNCWCEYCAN